MRAQATLLVGAGVAAALHVAKLPPALVALREALGLSLVQAGFLLSAVQLAGMLAGVAFGAAVDGLGHRRSLVGGLVLLAGASAIGAFVDQASALLLLRACEGCGFLLVVLAAPPLLRQVVPLAELPRVLAVWGAYVPMATAAAFLVGPPVTAAWGWRPWWFGLAVLTAAVAAAAWRGLDRSSAPPSCRRQDAAPAPAGVAPPPSSVRDEWVHRLRLTLRRPGPWCVALAFGCYSSQWLAVVGFLPALYAEAGWKPAVVALASAAVAAGNALGNIAAGRALRRGWTPAALLRVGLGTMAVAALVAFDPWPGWMVATPVQPLLQVAAVFVFSTVGGVVPGTLFGLAVRLAPSPQAVGTTLGWVQQLSATGQFCGPPLVAWVASRAGGWQYTGWVTACLAVGGLLLVQRLLALVRLQDGLAAVSPSQHPSQRRP